MATIYASIDAVNHHRSMETLIPDDVILSSEEEIEVYEFERALRKDNSTTLTRNWRVNLSTTDNKGLFYASIETRMMLDYVALNPNIDSTIAVLIANAIKKKSDTHVLIIAGLSLLSNPVVRDNSALFQYVWNMLMDVNQKDSSPSDTFEPLRFSIAIVKNKDQLAENCLFVLSSSVHLIENDNYSAGAKKDYIDVARKWIETHETETLQWVAENQPDFENLPIDWLLALWGLD